jgi:hypothetical protein
MPWAIKFVKGSPKPYRVYNKDTGEDKGGSTTQEKAKKHLAALYANAPEAKKGK